MRVTIFHNPTAGHDQSTDQDLIRAIERAGYEPVYCSTEDSTAVVQALREPGDLAVAAGGDGTVRKIATRLIGRHVPMTVLPVGTANNIARSLGISGEPHQLVAGWASAVLRRFDVGRMRAPWGDSFFLEGTGFGPSVGAMSALSHVAAAPSPDGDPRDEIARDLRVFRELLADHPLHDCQVTLDGDDLSGAYVLVEAMNIRSIGPNIELAPDADFSDGQLDLVLLTDANRSVLRDYLTDRLDDRDARLDLPVHRGRSLAVVWQGSRVHVDDEIWPDEEDAASGKWWRGRQPVSIDVSLDRHALEFLVPVVQDQS